MSTDHLDKPKYTLQKTIVLVGMMGSGKTAIGRALAEAMDVPFLDSDAALEEAATQTISEIFERDGEAFFRKREAEVIQRLIGGPAAILSTGGGAYMASRSRQVIEDNAVSVWLNADLETLWERVRYKDTRPLLRTADPYGTLKQLFDDRRNTYAKAAIHADIGANASIDETTQGVISQLLTHSNILKVAP